MALSELCVQCGKGIAWHMVIPGMSWLSINTLFFPSLVCAVPCLPCEQLPSFPLCQEMLLCRTISSKAVEDRSQCQLVWFFHYPVVSVKALFLVLILEA